MPITWEQESDNLLVSTVTGRLNHEDILNFRRHKSTDRQAQDKLYLLTILKDFSGWDASENWDESEEIEVLDEYDKHLSRFAIVGDAKWRDDIELFTLAGLRAVDIRYFTSESEARDWLSEE